MSKTCFLFTPRHPPVLCGVADHTVLLAKRWRQAGKQVEVITHTAAAAGQSGVTVAEQNSRWWKQWAKTHAGSVLLWQYSPYALHPRGIPWWMVRVMFQLRIAGVRQAIFFHEVQIRYSVPGGYNKLRALQQQIIANLCARLAGGRVATSIPLYQTYFWGNPLRLIPVSPNLLPPAVPAAVQPGLVVAFANRIFPWLIDALVALQTQVTSLEVVWLGKASAGAEDLVTSKNLRCRFTGVLSLEDLALQMQQAAIVLLPLALDEKQRGGISLKSGTLSAALGMGKPVVATAGDMTETEKLQHGQVLHLLPQNTPGAWQTAIHTLLTQPAYAEKLATGAASFYQQHLTWEITAAAVVEMVGPPRLKFD